jgi:hypothetical protein
MAFGSAPIPLPYTVSNATRTFLGASEGDETFLDLQLALPGCPSLR